MRIGIIAEFNPLHSGHRYLINEAKKCIEQNGEGEIICVMSEFFTQRGEVALVDGYTRAKEAVRSGCDLVIALPYLGSVAYSDDFAKKSIEILAGSGITHLIFGTENTDIASFEEIYEKQQKTSHKDYQKLIKKGYNFAKINSELYGFSANNPNQSLAYSYYKALRENSHNIELIAIKRQGQNLNDEKLENKKHLSATAIRKNINAKEVELYLSEEILTEIRRKKILNEEDFFTLLKYKIISLGKEGIAEIYDVNEGLENRIYEVAQKARSHEELVEGVATKRYSKKKIQRILLHILTNTTKEDYKKYFTTKTFRVLAAKKEKASLIREVNSRGEIALVPVLNSTNSMHFSQDIKVARVYNIVAKDEDIFRKKIELE